MRPIVTGEVVWSVCRSVTVVSCAKTAEMFEMLFESWTRVGPRKHVNDAGTDWRQVTLVPPGEYA